MKYLIVFLYALIFISNGQAQHKVQLKIYYNTDAFDVGYRSFYSVTTSRKIDFSRISIALSVTAKKKWIHEFEVFIPEIKKSPERIQFPFNYTFNDQTLYVSTASAYAFRYELNRSLITLSKCITFSPGIAVNPYFVDIENMSNDTQTHFDTYLKFVGMSFSVVPRLTYGLSNRFAIDLNVPFKVYDLHKAVQHIANPVIPISQQTNGGMEHSFFTNTYTIRIGLVFSLIK